MEKLLVPMAIASLLLAIAILQLHAQVDSLELRLQKVESTQCPDPRFC